MRVSTAIIAVALVCSGCDFEHKIRRWLSDPGERKNPTKDKPDEPLDSRLRTEEPNNDADSASTFTLDSELRPIEGELAADDLVDWIEVTADANARYELSVEPTGELDVSVHVQIDEETISQNEKGPGESERVRNVALTGLKFAVKTESGEGKYYIRFKRSADQGQLEQEPNDLGKTATEWKVPSEMKGYADRTDDRDVFKLVPVTDAQKNSEVQRAIALEFRGVPGAMHVVRLFDNEDLKTPINAYSVQPNAVLIIPALATDRPIWLVVSTPGSGHAGRYVLKTIDHPPNADALETEPNDTVAIELREGVPMMGYFERPEDVDQFKVVLSDETADPPPVIEGLKDKTSVPETVVVHVEPLHDDLWIGGTFGAVTNKGEKHGAGFALCGLKADEQFSLHPIEEKSAKPGFDYKLVVKRGGDREPNNDKENAESLTDVRRGVVSSDDTDLYGFFTQGGSVTVALQAEAPVEFKLYDDQMGLIATSEAGLNQKVTVDLPQGMYFAAVAPGQPGARCVEFTISLTQPADGP